LEFVELQNIGAESIRLDGVRFNGGIEFHFSDGLVTNLEPGQHVVVVQDEAAFRSRYDATDVLVAGSFAGGSLNNGGERIVVEAADGTTIHDFQYGDQAPWPVEADGQGPSLEVIDLGADYNDPGNWRASRIAGGTPGRRSDLPGDANRNGVFDSSDLVAVLQAGEFEDQAVGNSTWEEGDWNGDGDFTTTDLVMALQAGGYSPAARSAPLLLPLLPDMGTRYTKRLPALGQTAIHDTIESLAWSDVGIDTKVKLIDHLFRRW
jgi:hypothetical protein